MGFVSDILGGSNGAGFQAQGTNIISPFNQGSAESAQRTSTNSIDQQRDFAAAVAAQNGLGNQSSVFNQLQGVANGTGPNPAMAQLNQATGANVANQAALMAGQRGAGANAGLLARLAAQQGGALQQQAVGQGATMQANQSLNALGQLGGIAGQQVGQQQNALSGLNSAAQNNQNAILNQIQGQNNANVSMQSNINNANAGIAQGNQKSQSELLGGALNGAAGLASLAFAGGGSVPGYATGGAISPVVPMPTSQPQSFATNYFNQMGNTSANAPSGISQGVGALGKVIGNLFQSKPVAPTWGNSAADYQALPEAGIWGNNAADYGALPDAQPLTAESMVENPMSDASMPLPGNTMMASTGGKVPGRAQVRGDSYSNDTVNAKLSPGEIVIPRSILEGKNPVQMAAKFVESELLKQHKSKKNNFADGGTAAGDDQKPVVVNVNNGPAQPEAPQDPAAAFYAQRQAVLEAKNPAFKPEPVDNRAADFYSQRNQDAQAGVPYQAGVVPQAPLQMGAPGPTLASNSPAPTANTVPGISGELGGQQSVPGGGLANPASQSSGLMNQALNEQLGGAKAEAKAQSDLGMAQAAIEHQQQANMAQQQANYENSYKGLEAERMKFQNDIEQGHIDPKRYVGDMSTGQKFSTAIGLILGGMGGALTHQENPALKFLNNQIENDINAQKSELDKKQNLLSMNMKQFGNLDQATNMTRVMMATMADSQLKEAMAKAQDPLAKARLQQAQGQLHEKYAPIMQQMATRQALMNAGSRDTGSVIELAADPKEKEALYKDLATRQESDGLKKLYQEQFTHLQNKALNGAFSPADRQSAIQAVAGKIQKATEGRYNLEAATQLAQALFPNKIESGQTTQNKLGRGIELLNGLSSTPRLDTFKKMHGIQDAPEAAAAPETATKDGVKYIKVQGGWKRAS